MRDKVLLLVLVASISSTSFAQQQEDEPTTYISKGQWLVGGELSLSTGEDFETYAFSVTPMGGYFIGKKLAAGLYVSYQHLNIVSPDPGPVSAVDLFSAAPFLRYYLGTNRVAPFAEALYGGSWSRSESTFNGEPSVSKNSSLFYAGGIGLNYFVSKNVALEGVVRYSKTIDSYYDGSFGLDLGLQFFLSRNSTSDEAEENYISKGQWLIGGSGNISLGTIDELDFNQFSITPMAGYFVGEKIAVGLSTGYNYYKGSSQSFFIQPFARYYFTQHKVAPFAEVAYGGSWARFEYPSGNGEVVEKISGTGYRIGAGLNYFVSRNVALEGNLRYSRNSDADAGTINFSAGLQFFIR